MRSKELRERECLVVAKAGLAKTIRFEMQSRCNCPADRDKRKYELNDEKIDNAGTETP